MKVIRHFFRGVVSVLTVSPPPPPQYPARNVADAFQQDWRRIHDDIIGAMDTLDAENTIRQPSSASASER